MFPFSVISTDLEGLKNGVEGIAFSGSSGYFGG